MQMTRSIAIMQVLSVYCNYNAGVTFCYIQSAMLVDLSVAIMHYYSVRSFCSTYASDSLCTSNTWVIIFIMQVGVSVTIIQVLPSAVHNCFCYKMQVAVSGLGDTFK